uniref:Transmembrane protein n=1 Tax=Spironucleus salmonicida TaxID=348837 RepID=V6LFX8_9EUKA|eukprot:EST43168.1 Hypothetical protein SS50377_17175 [Spironucleus salmonicida]
MYRLEGEMVFFAVFKRYFAKLKFEKPLEKSLTGPQQQKAMGVSNQNVFQFNAKIQNFLTFSQNNTQTSKSPLHEAHNSNQQLQKTLKLNILIQFIGRIVDRFSVRPWCVTVLNFQKSKIFFIDPSLGYYLLYQILSFASRVIKQQSIFKIQIFCVHLLDGDLLLAYYLFSSNIFYLQSIFKLILSLIVLLLVIEFMQCDILQQIA